MTEQLAFAMPSADAASWYLPKLDQRWVLIDVVLEEEHVAVLRCHRIEDVSRVTLLYIPRYGRVVEDVYVEENGHIRATKDDRLLA